MDSQSDPRLRDLGLEARPAPYRGVMSEVFRYICWGFLKLFGWKLEGAWPYDTKKMIVIAAPHTSNWDGFFMVAAGAYYRIKFNWMGKRSLTVPPHGWITKAAGCVPVDRKGSNDVVSQMTETFNQREHLVLAIAPEGTRRPTKDWKSGFYHIAYSAGVPLLITVLDYGRKRVRLAGLLQPTGDYDKDMEIILSKYQGAEGKIKGGFVLPD